MKIKNSFCFFGGSLTIYDDSLKYNCSIKLSNDGNLFLDKESLSYLEYFHIDDNKKQYIFRCKNIIICISIKDFKCYIFIEDSNDCKHIMDLKQNWEVEI